MYRCADGANQFATPCADYVRAIELAPARNGARLTVTSADVATGVGLPDMLTRTGGNKSPALAWSAGPAGTQSYVLLAEDRRDTTDRGDAYWIIYDIPASARSLPQGVPHDLKVMNPVGATNAVNPVLRTVPGYGGVLAGSTVHFQVFALDIKLGLDPTSASRLAIIAAMKNHVLASGEIVGN
jgi:Raf kinase inhibitor-like YbhB/YbcL family protein